MHLQIDLHLAALLGIFTCSRLCHAESESSKTVTLKSTSLDVLHAVDNSCSPGAHAHLLRLLKQQGTPLPSAVVMQTGAAEHQSISICGLRAFNSHGGSNQSRASPGACRLQACHSA